MRLLTLYIRVRAIPAALGVMVIAAVGFWAIDVPDVRPLVLAIGLGVGAAAGGLGGHDVELDRTAAIAWFPRRALHLAAIAAVMSGLLLLTDLGITEVIVRDCVGLTGLAALGATVLGRQLAWSPPVTWTLCSVALPVPDEVVNWMRQPPDTTAATLTAAVLGVAGAAVYTVFGPRAGA
jgi:hypothetical protein